MKDRKYILTDETIEWKGRTLYRIQAVRDILNSRLVIKNGELGGWVESEKNLSQDGGCWISGAARAYDNARIFGNSDICMYAEISENVTVADSARITERAVVTGNACICENAVISGDSIISGNSYISGNVLIFGDSTLTNETRLKEHEKIGANALIKSDNDILSIGPLGSRGGYTTFYKSVDNDIWVCCGCFNGSIKDFEDAVKRRHGDKSFGAQYLELIPFVKKWLGNSKVERKNILNYPPFNAYCCRCD